MASTAEFRSPRLIVIVRHGETEWSASGRHTGRTDLPLTEAGQIEALGASGVLLALLGAAEPTRIYSSPRQRALLTAKLALNASGDQVIVDERLREFEYGDYEGLKNYEIQDLHPGWEVWKDGCPNGETAADVAARCDSFIADLAANDDGGVVIVFCHGHLSRGLTCRLLNWPIESAAAMISDTASAATITTRRGARALTAWNARPLGATVHPSSA
jgi:broad specificity phosphatase PhoE